MKVYIKFSPTDSLQIRNGLIKDKISRLGKIEIFEYVLHARGSLDTATFPPDQMEHFDLFLINADFVSISYFLHPGKKWPYDHLDKTSDL